MSGHSQKPNNDLDFWYAGDQVPTFNVFKSSFTSLDVPKSSNTDPAFSHKMLQEATFTLLNKGQGQSKVII